MGIRIKARTAVPTWVANLFGFDGHMTLHEGIISCDDLQCHPEAFNHAGVAAIRLLTARRTLCRTPTLCASTLWTHFLPSP